MRAAGLTVVLAASLLVPHSAHAATFSSQDSASGTVSVSARTSPVYGGGGGGGSGPSCSWVPLNLERDPDADEFTEGEVVVSPTGVGPAVEEEIGGVLHRLYRVECPDGRTSDRWVRVGVTVADLLPGVIDRAAAVLRLPVPDINPEPADGGIVNVGLWLAVEPQSVPSLSAEAGPGVWITMSPRLTATRFDFGNGDQVSCDGTGVPIRNVYPDLEVLEESPWCGYTYRSSSPDTDPYLLSVTTVWELPYASSTGSGAAPPLERVTTVTYDVDEIQTIGVSN